MPMPMLMNMLHGNKTFFIFYLDSDAFLVLSSCHDVHAHLHAHAYSRIRIAWMR
jgi:hypothetical protein